MNGCESMPGMAETRLETQLGQTMKQGMVMGSARSKIPIFASGKTLCRFSIATDLQG